MIIMAVKSDKRETPKVWNVFKRILGKRSGRYGKRN